MSPARRSDLVMAATGVLVILLDQLTKHWVMQYFTPDRAPIQLVGHVLELQYVQNTGVAFSLFEGQAILFLFVAIAIGVIGVLYWRARESGSIVLKLTFGLILGGAIGNNLIDRLIHRYVVDFIHFQIPGVFDWPVFNVADSAISVGVVLLAILLWRGETGVPAAAHDTTVGDTMASAAAPEAETPRVRRRVVSGK